MDGPWMSPRDRELIERILALEPQEVFEYGAGGSTVTFRPKAKLWESVEHDPTWKKKLDDAECFVFLAEDMVRYIGYCQGPYDIVLIDGRERVDCLKHCTDKHRRFVLCHDGRRTAYLDGLAGYKWTGKVGDDFIIASNFSLSDSYRVLLEEFDFRDILAKSIAWG